PSVVRRVQRTYATDVDVPAFVAAALGAVQALGPGSGEPAAVFKSAINAALGTLDPHSRYLDAREQRDERDSSRGYGGLGMEVDMDGGLVRVVSPMDGMPAARAGLKSGDLIVRFGEKPVLGMTLAEAIAFMRGEVGTAVSLIIRRPGRADEFEVSVVR